MGQRFVTYDELYSALQMIEARPVVANRDASYDIINLGNEMTKINSRYVSTK
jgi:hypothetical protein